MGHVDHETTKNDGRMKMLVNIVHRSCIQRLGRSVENNLINVPFLLDAGLSLGPVLFIRHEHGVVNWSNPAHPSGGYVCPCWHVILRTLCASRGSDGAPFQSHFFFFVSLFFLFCDGISTGVPMDDVLEMCTCEAVID